MKKFIFSIAIIVTSLLLGQSASATDYWIYRWAIMRNSARLSTTQATITAKTLPDKIPWAQTISYIALYNPDLGLAAGYAETGVGWQAGGDYCRNLARKKQNPIDATCIWYADEANGHVMSILAVIPINTPVTIKLIKNTNNTVTATYQWSINGSIKNLSKVMNVGNWYTGLGQGVLEVEVDTNSLYNDAFWDLPANAKPGNVHFSFSNMTIPDPNLISFWSSEESYFNIVGAAPYSVVNLDVSAGVKY